MINQTERGEAMTQSKTVFQIGEDLYGVSIQELEARIAICEAEAERIRQELAKKQAELSAADTFFGQKP